MLSILRFAKQSPNGQVELPPPPPELDLEIEPDLDLELESTGGTGSSSDWRPLDDLDELVDRAWEPLRSNPLLDRVFYTASSLGDWSLLWHLLGALLSFRGAAQRRNSWRLSAALAAESVLVNLVIKSLFRRRRPPPAGPRPHNLRQPVTSSFPSGHACSAFLAATLLAEASRRRWPWFVLAAVVATSRIHVRIHHASDVAGGIALGLLLGKLVKAAAPLGKKQQ